VTDVDVVAVTYNSAAFLPEWCDAMRSQHRARLRITIVDNASTDGSADLAADLLSGARVVRNPANEGFGRGANRGIATGSSPYVLVCNVDTTPSPDFIAVLADALDAHPQGGTACGKLLLDPGTIDSTGLQPYAPRLFEDRGHREPDDGRYDVAGEVFGASGALALYRRTMLDRIRVAGAVFDPDYFLYWEDIDLAWRARVAGWSAWYEPGAIAVHRRGSALGRGAVAIGAYAFAHRLFTIDKNDDPNTAPRASIHSATAMLAAGLARSPAQWSTARALIARRRAVARKRAEVQALRRTSALELESWFAPLSVAHVALERLRTRP